MAHSISAFLILLTTISLTFSWTSASASDSNINLPASTISAAPSSSLSLSSSLPPDISPLFPTPQLSPTESSLPIIPSTPSPPKPDDDAMAAQGPVLAAAPSRFLPDSSSLSLVSGGGFLSSLLLSGLVAFGLLHLSH
ncbi:classical arabinogalactan protein 26-like [Salvia miltiorrhiza]|uniref:classical arabinogalactan protein 26-like n=1 Tax=Salvia miltiorrhiza TaxID=226208 RepID=UPI0025AD3DFE|nr:classical arabinogalactan protein 26-like [Salvia miltiorrhiza]